MPAPLEILKVNHINQIVDDYDAALDHYRTIFGARFLTKIGANPLTDGCLIDIGGQIIELLVPKVHDKAEGKLLARYGPHYQGVELLVPSKDAALAVIRQRGIATLLERANDFYTRPSATQGVCLQIFDGDWHRDPPPTRYVEPKRPAGWWRDEHPIGMTGLDHLSFACPDLVSAEAFWCDLTGGTVTYRQARPGAGAAAVGLDIGIPVELIAPNGPGRIADYLERYGPRIRATTFAVRSLEAAARYFACCGLDLEPGDVPGSLMVPPAGNYQVVYQFVAARP